MKKSNLWLGLSAIGVLMTMTLATGTQIAYDNEGLINDVLGLNVKQVGKTDRSDYAEADGSLSDAGWKRMIQDSYKFCVEEEEQGSVLLKNENGCLPLAANERKVTLFGYNSAHLFYRSGAGGAAPNPKLVVRLEDAMKNAGFEINPTVWNLYSPSKTFSAERVNVSNGDPEKPVSIYTQAAKDSFADYNDAAIVTFRRCGTEDSDPGAGALDFQPNEKALLKMIKDSGQFKKIIVLINSPMPMSMDWADNEEYGVDAILYFGVPGYYSMDGVAHVLTGQANPSGHTTVTFSRHCDNSAAYQNFGNPAFSNGGGNYVVYKEGIYVGYKYYESRYADCVLGRGNANGSAGTYDGETEWDYAREVGYPFGYGLSYTTFKQKMTDIKYDAAKDEFTATIEVENTGDRDGLASAQVWAQVPYDANGDLEKSAIQLAGYEKVEVKAHGKATAKVSFKRMFLTSYDNQKDNVSGTKGGYVLEDGTYYFACGNGAHEALNNILGKVAPTASLFDHLGNPYTANLDAVKSVEIKDAYDAYQYSIYNEEEEIHNRFDDADLNYWANDNQKITYLTRKDWQGTFPTAVTSLEANNRMKTAMDMSKLYTKPADAKKYSEGKGVDYEVKLDETIRFSDMATKDFDDPLWDDFIKQMSLQDLTVSMADNRGILAVASVSKPSNSFAEGPEGLLMPFAYGDGRWATGFATGPVYTGTWDHAMQSKLGAFYGEEALYCGVAGVNAPGTNICRTAYTSRASEYMSEDGVMNYYCAGNIIGAARKKGLIMNIKHCFLNNQEKNRQRICTFANEQAIREIFLRPFEGALCRGEGLGIMTSYNRIGLTYAAAHKELAYGVMRGEWNFKGLIIDDALSGGNSDAYSNTAAMIEGGTNVFCLDGNRGSQIRQLITGSDDGYMLEKCQIANKHIMWACAQSWMGDAGRAAAESGADVEEVKETFKWWKPVVWGVDGIFAAFTLTSVALFALYQFVFKPKGAEAVEEGGAE